MTSTVFRCAPSGEGRSGLLLARVEIRKILPKVSNFWSIVIDDVRIVGMTGGVVLVVSLGGIKGFQRDHLSHNGTREDFGLVQLRDVRLGNSLLLIAVIENGRAILAAGVWSLTVQLRGIVRDREEDLKKLSIRSC